jgi:hypothetical protein
LGPADYKNGYTGSYPLSTKKAKDSSPREVRGKLSTHFKMRLKQADKEYYSLNLKTLKKKDD